MLVIYDTECAITAAICIKEYECIHGTIEVWLLAGSVVVCACPALTRLLGCQCTTKILNVTFRRLRATLLVNVNCYLSVVRLHRGIVARVHQVIMCLA